MLSREVLHELGVIPVGHKADVLAVVLAGVDEVPLLRNLPHLGLVQAAQRQAYPGQLLLGEVVQHIALVFALVQSLFQEPAARGLVLLYPA